MEYKNLIMRLAENRINLKNVAVCLNINEKTMVNKIYGKSKLGFSWEEATKIHERFLPQYNKEYLFFRGTMDIEPQTEKEMQIV